MIVVHTGLMKAASTYIQHNVFPYVAGATYISKNDQFGRAFEKAIRSNALQQTANTLDEMKLFYNELEKSQRMIIISAEKLSCDPRLFYENFEYNTRRLSHVLPEARIIFVIRRQDTFFESYYLHQVRKGSPLNYKDFLNIGSHRRYSGKGDSRVTDYRCLDLVAMIDTYVETFGKGNVLVLMQEQLEGDPDLFLRKISEFLCISEKLQYEGTRRLNLRQGHFNFKGRLYLNRIYNSQEWHANLMMRALRRSVSEIVLRGSTMIDRIRQRSAYPIGQSDKQIILEYHEESNLRLKKYFPESELVKYGYCQPGKFETSGHNFGESRVRINT